MSELYNQLCEDIERWQSLLEISDGDAAHAIIDIIAYLNLHRDNLRQQLNVPQYGGWGQEWREDSHLESAYEDSVNGGGDFEYGGE